MPRRPSASGRSATESRISCPRTSSAEDEASSRSLSVASLTPNEAPSRQTETTKVRANACPAYRYFRNGGEKKMICKLCEERNPDRHVIVEINKYCSSTIVWRHL